MARCEASGGQVSDVDREAQLEAALREAVDLFASCYVEGAQPDDIKRRRAYLALDRKCRELGVLPAVKA